MSTTQAGAPFGQGDPGNRVGRLQPGLGLDRRSRSQFHANAFRVLFTAAAYGVLQAPRRHLSATACAGSQVSIRRESATKLGIRVRVSTRRIVIHSPAAFPWLAVWEAASIALGARSE
jgi:hypothetical protein